MARGKGGSKGSYRSAISGRYVTAAHGRRSPRTTVRESGGSGGRGASSGGRNRSAITGRFISNAAAARHPNTSVREGS
jgi:hypothetical protein